MWSYTGSHVVAPVGRGLFCALSPPGTSHGNVYPSVNRTELFWELEAVTVRVRHMRAYVRHRY